MKRVMFQKIKNSSLKQMEQPDRIPDAQIPPSRRSEADDQPRNSDTGKNQPKSRQSSNNQPTDPTNTLENTTDLSSTRSSFKSDYALRINEQFNKMAVNSKVDEPDNTPAYKAPTEKPNTKHKSKGMKKLRKWFGDDTSEDSSSDNDSDNEWNKVNRQEKNRLKKKHKDEKNTELQRITAVKTQHLLGIGPITPESIDFHKKSAVSYEFAKKKAVK